MNPIQKTICSLALIIILVRCTPSTTSVPLTVLPSPSAPSTSSISPIYWPTAGWRTSTPEGQGMDSEVLAQMNESLQGESLNPNSLLVIRNGYLVDEIYKNPYSASQLDHIFSVTKSVIGTLVGIAIQKGDIKNVQQPIFEILSDSGVNNLDAQKKAITLENLLTQTSGLKCPDVPAEGEIPMEASDNWVQFMLDQPMEAQPGTKFNYCTATTHLVSAILQKATGTTSRDYANQYLFTPLGITPIMEDRWPSDPQGITLGGYGLVLTPDEMAKLGYLFLNKGEWDGQSIVPAAWVEASTTSHSNMGEKKEYGYLWWVDPQGKWYAALGRGGHHIFVYPAENLVVAYTATLPYTNDADLIPLQDLLAQYILPSIKSDQPLATNPAGQVRLQLAIQSLSQPVPAQLSSLPVAASTISGKTFTLAENPFGWQTMIFTFEAGSSETTVTMNGMRQLVVGLDNIYRINAVDDKVYPEALRGNWDSQDTFAVEDIKLGQLQDFEMQVKYTGDLIAITVLDNITGNQLELQGTQNN